MQNGVEGTQETREELVMTEMSTTSGLEQTAPEKPKKGQKWGIVILAVLLVMAVAAAGTFGMLWWQEKEKVPEVERETEVVETVTKVDKFTTAADLKLTREKCRSEEVCRLVRYETSRDTGVVVWLEQNLESGANELIAQVDWERLDWILNGNLNYDRNSSVRNYEEVAIEGVEADNVVDVVIGTTGQDSLHETIYLLMKDGTVEYIPLMAVAKEHKFHTHGKLEDIEDVILLKQVSLSVGCGGGLGVIAQKANGEYWSLFEVLEGMGVWN